MAESSELLRDLKWDSMKAEKVVTTSAAHLVGAMDE